MYRQLPPLEVIVTNHVKNNSKKHMIYKKGIRVTFLFVVRNLYKI